MSATTARVIGAGFTGMLAAYFLVQKGRAVTLIDRGPGPGGLIRTLPHPQGDVETGANGFLGSALLEEVAETIGVELVQASAIARKNRYLWVDCPSRWPLTILETLGLALRFILSRLTGRLAPRELETIEDWGLRCLGSAATQKLLTPGLLGIYASPPSKLSAGLVMGRFFVPKKSQRAPRPLLSGTVAPAQGMGEWFRAMHSYLQGKGVRFVEEEAFPIAASGRDGLTVICTSAPEASRLLAEADPGLASRLAAIPMLPVVSLTVFTREEQGLLHGFGCLFHPGARFSSLGVLFGSDIFPHRFGEKVRAETWILGGEHGGAAIAALSDGELLERVRADRRRMGAGATVGDEDCVITRWPKAFPLYGLELEKTLACLPAPPPGVLLLGNYLGSLGLSQIAQRVRSAIEEIPA